MIAYTEYLFDARVRREAETLDDTGQFHVTVLALKMTDRPRLFELENVKVEEVNVRKYGGRNKLRYVLSYICFIWLCFCKCTKKILKSEVDIVHVHNMPDILVFAAIIARFYDKKLILDIHDSMPETFASKFRQQNKGFWFKALCLEEFLSTCNLSQVNLRKSYTEKYFS